MARPIGSKSTLNGKSVLWAGDNYGWQSPGSYKNLEQQGKFKVGAQAIDRLVSGVASSNPIKTIQGFQQSFRKATDNIPGIKQLDRLAVNGSSARVLPSDVVEEGGAILAQRVGEYFNLDPRLGFAAGLLVGGVHTSGPKKGTYKFPDQGHKQVDAIEDLMEGTVFPTVKKTVDAIGKPSIAGLPKSLPDGTPVRYKNHGAGSWNYPNRGGISVYLGEPPTVKPAAASKPNVSTPVQAPKPVAPVPSPSKTANAPTHSFGPPPRPEQPRLSGTPRWANTPDLESGRKSLIDAGLPDPNSRFNPLPKPEHRTFPGRAGKGGYEVFATVPHPKTGKVQDSISEFYSQSKAEATIDGVVYKPGKDNTYAVPGTDKPLRIGDREIVIEGAASRQARVREIPGNENIKVDSEQAHHIKPLKDLASFAKMFDDPSLVYRTLDEIDEVYGSTILNRLDLSTRSHQPSFPNSVHDRLLNRAPGSPESGYILEAPQGTSRWGFLEGLSDEDKLKYLPYLLADAEQNVRAAQQVAFSEHLLHPGSHPLTDKYVGDFAQRVMAPPNKEALKLIRQLTVDTRKAFRNRSLLKLNGTP
jgi:hypothetical protein